MPINMGDQFRGLPMGDLIGGPLMAACDAQVRLANATAQFIQQIGFVPKAAPTPDGKPVPFDQKDFDTRTVTFKFDRPVAGATPTNGVYPTETVELDVPLLAIVKVPALGIDTVDITFDMEVKNTERQSETSDAKASFAADASLGWGPFSLKVHVEGSVATHKENTRETDQSAKYHVEVHASDKGMPEGLARVLDIMGTAVAPKAIVPSAPPSGPTPPPPPPPPPPSPPQVRSTAPIGGPGGAPIVTRTTVAASSGDDEGEMLLPSGRYYVPPRESD